MSAKSFSDKIRQRLAGLTGSGEPIQEEEKKQIRAIAEEIGNRDYSTIARVMAGGKEAQAHRQSSSASTVHRILERVAEHPGENVHQLAEALGQKSIFVLSHVDTLVREGMVIRLEDGRLYRSRDFAGPEDVEEEKKEVVSGGNHKQAVKKMEYARIYMLVFRFFTGALKIEPDCGENLRVGLGVERFFEMRPARRGASFTIYNVMDRKHVDRFKKESQLGPRRIYYSAMTGIVDVRNVQYQELEKVLPWVGYFFQKRSGE